MSAYKRIKCTITDKDILIKALGELGLTCQVHDAAQPLRGYQGEARTQTAEIIVPKEALNAIFTGASNDLGFAWNEAEKRYDIICSDYDISHKIPARIKQAYAKVVIEQALINQYFSVESTTVNELRQKRRVKVQVVGKKFI